MYYVGGVSVKVHWGQTTHDYLYDYTKGETPIKTDLTPGTSSEHWQDIQKGFNLIGLGTPIDTNVEFGYPLLKKTSGSNMIFSMQLYVPGNCKLEIIDYTDLESILNDK